MSFGWVDPDSVRMDGEAVLSDFYKADDGKRLILRVPAGKSRRLDSLLSDQSEHGVVFLNPDFPGLNAAETVRGTVIAENRTSGDAMLNDGRQVIAEFPQGTFDEPGKYAFRGTGVVMEAVMDVFAADTVAADDMNVSPQHPLG